MTFKEFITQYKPIKQNDKRNFWKYLIPNSYTITDYKLLCGHYDSRIFTITKDGKKLFLTPGKKFSIENSYFIICEVDNDLETNIIINL
jgi:hypothetical protein